MLGSFQQVPAAATAAHSQLGTKLRNNSPVGVIPAGLSSCGSSPQPAWHKVKHYSSQRQDFWVVRLWPRTSFIRVLLGSFQQVPAAATAAYSQLGTKHYIKHYSSQRQDFWCVRLWPRTSFIIVKLKLKYLKLAKSLSDSPKKSPLLCCECVYIFPVAHFSLKIWKTLSDTFKETLLSI